MNKVIAFLFLAGSLCAIEGKYEVTGFDPYDNKPYSGFVTIDKDKNEVFQARWEIVEAGEKFTYIGTGLKNGGGVSFAYKNGAGEKEEIGLQYYKIEGNGLEGPFVYIGKNLIGQEKLVKKP